MTELRTVAEFCERGRAGLGAGGAASQQAASREPEPTATGARDSLSFQELATHARCPFFSLQAMSLYRYPWDETIDPVDFNSSV
eukprot:g46627.t1